MNQPAFDAEFDQCIKSATSEIDAQLKATRLLGRLIIEGHGVGALMTTNIREFHEKFGLAYDAGPRHLPKDLSEFRVRFMQEELDEYQEAVEKKNLEKQFDALIDLVYVALGTAYLQGFPFDLGWVRVQAANMAKIRTPKPTERGGGFDVVKPAGWKAPDLTDLVNPIS